MHLIHRMAYSYGYQQDITYQQARSHPFFMQNFLQH